MSFEGPAIIEQSDSTPLVAPGFRARVDDAHNLILERS
jgi:N-methylhydantoinase A/oxoprolinase/acetone carboxylase beta subunit